jgi:hypothetical protein
MFGRWKDMRRIATAVIVVALLGAAVACTKTEETAVNCMTRPHILKLRGAQPRFDTETRGGVGDNWTVDATGATWTDASINYPVIIRTSPSATRNNMCFVGGSISTNLPQDTPFPTWHSMTGFDGRVPNLQIVATRIDNTGDGIGFNSTLATNFLVSGVHLSNIHDDCIQDDNMLGGTIEDSLFDGCYSGFSAMGFSGDIHDGSANTLTISNSLVRVADMVSVSSGKSPGHGGFFKFAGRIDTTGRGPKLVINNTIFRVDSQTTANLGLPNYLDPTTNQWVPYPVTCSNNTMVWLGKGKFPVPLPSCFKVTSDKSVWNKAVATWTSNH